MAQAENRGSQATKAELEPYDPFVPSFSSDPYPTYARYREAASIHWGVPPHREVYVEASKAADELSEYLKRIIEERRREPQDDLMTALIQRRTTVTG